jgi:hypothetical protein
MSVEAHRLGFGVAVALVSIGVMSAESAHAQYASVWGGVYGAGWPGGSIQYIDESLVRDDLPGVIGMYGELIHDNGGGDSAYILKAQSVLNTDTLQSSIAINNYIASPDVEYMDAWTNSYAYDVYTVTGGTPGDVVEAIFTCSVTGTMTITPQIGTNPNSHGSASFGYSLHGTYGDPAIIPNWIDMGMYIQYIDGGIDILSNDVVIYDDWDDDEYDLDRHEPIWTSLIEGQDYTISGDTVTINATFEFPVTMVSGHALDIEAALDLSADTANLHLYPDRGSEVIVDFWNTGINSIELAPEYQGTYQIERASGLPFACPWDTIPAGGDGTVGLGDLNALLSNWGSCPAPCPYDFAPEGGDGTVGLGDLNALLSNWGPCP